ISMPSNSLNPDATQVELLGCELRASLPDLRTSAVLLSPDGGSWTLNVGTIILTSLENAPGSTISLSGMTAPREAKDAYERGRKAVERKFTDAERELKQALERYPGFAEAWARLGEVHRQQADFVSAKAAYSRAISADTQFVNPYFGMAIVAAHEKN